MNQFVNFGQETRAELESRMYSINDIDWIGNREFRIDIDEFFKIADNTNYDAGFGSAHIPLDLIIFMKNNTYFIRKEYDGSEWWGYIVPPRKPKISKKIVRENLYSRFDAFLNDFTKE